MVRRYPGYDSEAHDYGRENDGKAKADDNRLIGAIEYCRDHNPNLYRAEHDDVVIAFYHDDGTNVVYAYRKDDAGDIVAFERYDVHTSNRIAGD